MSTTYVLEVPATPADIRTLLHKILEETECLEDRVKLMYGTCLLLCRNENEREEHPDTVNRREALATLASLLYTIHVLFQRIGRCALRTCNVRVAQNRPERFVRDAQLIIDHARFGFNLLRL